MLIARSYYVYFVTNKNHTVLYVGVTNNLCRRVAQHKSKFHSKSFTARYNCDRLVYYEEFESISSAISREKQLKNWKRSWKDALIKSKNPELKDLSEGWEIEL